MYQPTPADTFLYLLNNRQPRAIAWIQGSASQPQLAGSVKFYETSYGGVLVEAEIFGLPDINIPGSSDYYAGNMPHPQHAGDMPPLLGNQGYAYQVFYDKRFSIDEIIGRSVIIHSHADDFASQPSGNSGDKIGCGTIRFMVH